MSRRDTPQSPRYAWLLPLMTLGLVLGVVLARESDRWQLPAAALALSLTAAFLLPGKPRMGALVLAAAATGALLTYHANHPVLPPEGEYVVTGVIMDEHAPEDLHFRSMLGEVTLDGEPYSGDVYWSAYLDAEAAVPDFLTPGTRVTFTGRVYHPTGESNPGGYDFREALLADGIALCVYGMDDLSPAPGPVGLAGRLAALRHTLTLGLMRVMGDEQGALAAAMLLGARDYIAREDYAAFKKLGVSHILSVSGYHVGILAMLLASLLWPMHLPRLLRAALLGVLMALYALLTGAAPPVIRAGLLLMLREAGSLQQRKGLPLHLLCLAACCQLLMNPMQLFGASFQLTYGAMLGLVLVYPRLRDAYHSSRGWVNWLWRGFAASLAVQLGLLPAQMYFFGSFPAVSLVLNMFIIALMSGVMALYWLTLAVLPIPGVAEVVGAAAGLITRGLQAAIRFLAGIFSYSLSTPAANLLTVIGWALLMLGLSVLLRRRHALLRRILAVSGALLIALSMVTLPNTGTYWIQFSDGEADAALLHDEDAVILVDAGENAYTVADYLRSRHLKVDALILTHLHIDHAGGIEGLLELDVPVRVCYIPEDAFLAGDIDPLVPDMLTRLEERGTQIVCLSRGDVIETPNARLIVLWPQEGAVRTGQSANNTCMVLQAEIMGTSMLLTADMTSRYEHYVAIPADILKAAHHGSAESTSPEFLDAVSPQVILLSCGTQEREASFLPRAGDIPVYSTHSSGAVTIRFTPDAFTVETYLPR